MPIPPIGRRPSSGDVDLGTGIYLIDGVQTSADSSETDSAEVSALATVRGGAVTSGFCDFATDDEDFTAAEDEDTLTAEEETEALEAGAETLEAGFASLETGFDALETEADETGADDLGATALDAGIAADETATEG